MLRPGGLPAGLRDPPPGRTLLLIPPVPVRSVPGSPSPVSPVPVSPSLVSPLLARRVGAEFLGTGLLVTVIVGSGLAADRLSPGQPGLQLLQASIATALGLAVLVWVLGPVSGAHLNPVVTIASRVLGGPRGAVGVILEIVAQVAGAVAGCLLANAMFAAPTRLSTTDRATPGTVLAEVVATAGLVLVVFALQRTGRSTLVAPAIGAYIGAAYWFTSSTGFANPAVTVGRILSDGFAGIAPTSAPWFIAAQLVGAALGVAIVIALVPRPTPKETTVSETKPSVMFACVHNAGRSQMALGFFRSLAGDRAIVRSGGSAPGERLNPAAVAAMAEVGIDIGGETPTAWTPVSLQASDVIVTMGCGDECPFYPGKRYLDWELDDPAGQPIERVREIRDEIERRVRGLVAELGVGA